ncbi:copper transporter [Kineococcus sp. SYSU DK002]|uniref:copper transporter n=1 Tax=Kineococcus sp. SYSU DK002 TaxID=3383123 RepID=UPI003D7CA4B2
MIDFRYHVVSLVSVFLALAVGIVLGAGPLNEGISTGITDQVRQLTEEKNTLRTERDDALRTAEQQDAWAQAVAPALVARQLGGRSVAIVELPGADSSQVDATVDVLEAAGASVSSRVTVQDKWFDASSTAVADRRATAAGLSGQPAPTPTDDGGTDGSTDGASDGTGTAGVDALLATELARSLVSTELAQAGPPDQAAQTALSTLVDAGLVEVSGGADSAAARGTLALLVGGAADTDATSAAQESTADALTALARELDAASAGAVLAGPVEAAADGGPVAVLRADGDLSAAVSSVDDLDSPIGQVNVVLALRQQLSGGAGQYGTSDSATAVSPPLPAAAP